MDDLIEALTILRKYGNAEYPIRCTDNVLYIREIMPHDVTKEDRDRLKILGFSEDYNPHIGPCFRSHRFR